MNKSNILYIMKYVDSEGRDVGINDKKIGITNNIESREKSLSGTKGPIKVVHVKAWDIGSKAGEMESVLHGLLGPVNTEGEWFRDDSEELVRRVSDLMNSSFLSNDGIKELKLDTKDKEIISKVEKIKKTKRTEDVVKLLENSNGKVIKWKRYGNDLDIKIDDGKFVSEYGSFTSTLGHVLEFGKKHGLSKDQERSMDIWSQGKIDGVLLKDFVKSL